VQTDPFGVKVEAETEVGWESPWLKPKQLSLTRFFIHLDAILFENSVEAFPRKTPNCTLQHKPK